MSSVEDLLHALGDALAPWIGVLERDAMLRWTVIGLVWVLLMFRLFGRRVSGESRGYFNWYDWLVIAFGAALLWSFRFGL